MTEGFPSEAQETNNAPQEVDLAAIRQQFRVLNPETQAAQAGASEPAKRVQIGPEVDELHDQAPDLNNLVPRDVPEPPKE